MPVRRKLWTKFLVSRNNRSSPRFSFGPFVFLLHIIDLPEICGNDADIALFPGDTSLIKIGKQDATDMNSELERISHWIRQNKAALYTTKCGSRNFAVGKTTNIEKFY